MPTVCPGAGLPYEQPDDDGSLRLPAAELPERDLAELRPLPDELRARAGRWVVPAVAAVAAGVGLSGWDVSRLVLWTATLGGQRGRLRARARCWPHHGEAVGCGPGRAVRAPTGLRLVMWEDDDEERVCTVAADEVAHPRVAA